MKRIKIPKFVIYRDVTFRLIAGFTCKTIATHILCMRTAGEEYTQLIEDLGSGKVLYVCISQEYVFRLAGLRL